MSSMGKVKFALSVDEMAEALGIGRNKAYDLTRIEGFPAVHLGRRIIIPEDRLKEWLAQQADETTKGSVL